MSETYQVKVTKISNNPNKLRTNEIIGYTSRLPAVGESFLVLSDGLEFGIRKFTTSIVQKIDKTIENHLTVFTLQTLNSTYKVEVINTPTYLN